MNHFSLLPESTQYIHNNGWVGIVLQNIALLIILYDIFRLFPLVFFLFISYRRVLLLVYWITCGDFMKTKPCNPPTHAHTYMHISIVSFGSALTFAFNKILMKIFSGTQTSYVLYNNETREFNWNAIYHLDCENREEKFIFISLNCCISRMKFKQRFILQIWLTESHGWVNKFSSILFMKFN